MLCKNTTGYEAGISLGGASNVGRRRVSPPQKTTAALPLPHEARALLHADATVVIPMDFIRVPLTAIVGWLIYAERLDAFTVLGAAMILAGNLLNLRPGAREVVRAS